MDEKIRCDWCLKDQIYMDYHDTIWGVPVYDDRQLFEFINLEGAQAGLSWYTILVRMESYAEAFDQWDAHKIAQYDQEKVAKLLQNPGIIRNKLKVAAAIDNAKAFLAIQDEVGSFQEYIWKFVDHTPIINHWETVAQIPATTKKSDAMSKDLKKRGFRFVGSTICYAFMQATGMVDDHLVSCWKRTGEGT